MGTGSRLEKGTILLLVLLSMAALEGGLLADQCTPSLNTTTGLGSTISLLGADLSAAELQTAIDYWGTVCGTMAGSDFPAMIVGGSGDIGVQVNLVNGPSPGTCGVTRNFVDNEGRINSAEITLWTQSSAGQNCHVVDTLAHELGHVLGLDNATASECTGRIMGAAIILDGIYQTRSVTSEECNAVDGRWVTYVEFGDGDVGDGEGPCGV